MVTRSFNVLDRTQNVHSSCLIEASAGTGKTYSIENIVVRLLIDESEPCSLDQILIVTFTKAATADLKLRIRRNLCKIFTLLQGSLEEKLPDYLLAVREKGDDALNYAIQQIEQALACFEQAPIFTIHGFCHRMLKEYLFEGDTSLSLSDSEEGISPALIYRLIKDFFRTGLSENLVSHGQLQRLLLGAKGVEGLEKELFNLVTRGVDIAPVSSAQELFQQFCNTLSLLKQQVKWSKEQIIDDFYLHAEAYKEICNLQRKPKRENVDKVERFAALFAKEEWTLADFDVLINDGLYLVDALNPSQLKAKKQPIASDKLQCPDLIELLTRVLAPIVNAARNPDLILCAMAYCCKQQVKKYLTNKEIVGFDDLLTNMHRAVQQPAFALKVRERYSTAIIDEFQDTDPIQWEIFRTIFRPNGEGSGHLYLVGDPKQSIYGFRQADIYTYLAAGDLLGDERRFSLETNYRSTQPLIDALNVLFSEETAPGLIALPRLNQALPYQAVDYGEQVISKPFDDGRGSLHFFAFEDERSSKGKRLVDAEESYFLPFIATELLQLQAQGVFLNQCAVLVADRFQASRLVNYLHRQGLPTAAQHSEKLTETISFDAMKEILAAVLSPQHESSLKIALGGPLIAWSQSDVLALEDPFSLEPLIGKAAGLKRIWLEKGFSAFFHALLRSSWKSSGSSIAESLLAREGGLDIFHSIQQIAELLVEREIKERLPPRQLFEVLEEFQQLEEEGEQAIKKRANPENDGVRILTIHSSKGLEYEIVFALGVVNRSRKPSFFVPISQEQGPSLLTVVDNCEDERYIQYYRELDAEKIRQLYVAFTRAKQRLYVPLFFESSRKCCDQGTASPLELYLARMGHVEDVVENLYARIGEISKGKTLENLSKLAESHSITISTFEPAISSKNRRMPEQELALGIACDEFSDLVMNERLNDNRPHSKPTLLGKTADFQCLDHVISLTAPPKAKIAGVPVYMHSFTSLSAKRDFIQVVTGLEISPPSDYASSIKSVHTLPAGSQIGVLLHELLEVIPFEMGFEEVSCDKWKEFIQQFVGKTPFDPWSDVIAEMVHHALSMPLKMDDFTFCLRELLESHCYREHEFIYSADKGLHFEFEQRPGYLKGVIDLIFEHNGKFYLLDWKSNWLGPDNTWYTEESVNSAMEQHDYYLQADIYKEALKRYLKLIDPRPFEEIFGGVFYVFLRGLEAKGVKKV